MMAKGYTLIGKLPSPELTPPLAAISRLRQIMSMTMIINDGAVLDRVLALTNSVPIPTIIFSLDRLSWSCETNQG